MIDNDNMIELPTSDEAVFMQQLQHPNQHIPGKMVIKKVIQQINKNLVLSFVSDSAGCGHIRNIFPMSYLNAIFGRDGEILPILMPCMIYDPEILARTRTIFFQRHMAPAQLPAIERYKSLQKQYGFKMVYDIDDFIWNGPDKGECIPSYNFGSTKIKDTEAKTSIIIMNLMDTVCVSTLFLKTYLETHGVTSHIVVVPNTVPKYFWEEKIKAPLTTTIIKPRVIYTGSPTHYDNINMKKGDWENAWYEWVINNVTDNKISFLCLGGVPWFFEGIKNKTNYKCVDWLNSYNYHLPIKKFKPDFGIAPLVPNYFNYSKSHIKYQEYCAAGCIGMGTVFTNGKPSPYDVCQVKVKDTASVNDINQIFRQCCEPDKYNAIITAQYKQLNTEGWWLESEKYINLLTSIL